jgi:hypothetical protein
MKFLNEGDRAKFNRKPKGMWDSSNNGLTHGTPGYVSEVRLREGTPWWYEFTTDGGTAFRVDLKQLTPTKQATPKTP